MDIRKLNDSPFPLNDMQSAYFVGEQQSMPLATTAQHYREIECATFDIENLEAAWGKIIDRHEVLRTVVTADGNQCVLDYPDNRSIVIHDLTHLPPVKRTACYARTRMAMMGMRLPLNKLPQARVEASVYEARIRLHFRANLWILDAIAFNVIVDELLQLCYDPTASLPDIRHTFRDYMASCAIPNDDENLSRSRAYWNARLATLPPGPELPLKCAAEELGKPVFYHLDKVISADKWAQFISTSKKHSVTPSMAALAAYALTLARWSKRKHFTITLLLSKSRYAKLDITGVAGNYGTTVLLEIDARGARSFSDFAASIQKQLREDIRHLAVSGVEVAREINRINATPFRFFSPITFTSVTGLYETANPYAVLKEASNFSYRIEVPQVYLDHQILEEPHGELTINWDVVSGLFRDGVPEDMFSTYTTLIETLASHPDTWHSHIKTTLPHHQEMVLTHYNLTEYKHRRGTLDEFIDERIALRPEHPAVIHGEVKLTYRELGEQSDAICHALRQFVTQPGVLIAVMLPKGWQQIVSVLGIVRTGAAYVPIDPDLPPSRRQQLLQQSRVTTLLTLQSLKNDFEWPSDLNIVCVDALSESASTDALKRPQPHHSDNDAAYVIFTSGSTGVPKGVVIDHRGVVNTLCEVGRILGITPDDRVLALSSLSFDLSVFDIFGTLMAGGTIILPSAAEQQHPGEWCRLIREHGVTLWNSVPALCQLLIDFADSEKIELPTLRHVMLSGDWIPRTLPEQASTVARHARLFSLGGATEASIWSVIFEIKDLTNDWKSIPYGRPLANQQLYVLDEALDACPLWATGELYIGGKGLAVCYLHDDVKTNERFITHPLTGQRLYRTGDMARLRPNGYMEFLGREDHQIKIRGFRIELGDIESHLMQHRQVQAAALKLTGSSDATKRLVAFVVPKIGKIGKTGQPLLGDDIKQHLAKSLPRYMVPDVIQIIDALPLTPNGKVDLGKLETIQLPPKPVAAQTAVDRISVDDHRYQAVQQMWKEMLAQDEIHPDARFFDLGGTSFQALQLLAKIRERFGIRLDLNDIAAGLSLHEMAIRLAAQPQPNGEDKRFILPLRPANRADCPSIFCVHPVGGGTHCYVPLARCISPLASVFGIQLPHHLAHETTPHTVEQLAESYVEAILSTSSQGPLLLIGWSMGGVVACEMAYRLRQMDKDVAFIGLIDPYCARQIDTPAPGPKEMLTSFCKDLAGVAGKSFIPHATTPDEHVFEHFMADMSRQSILPNDLPTEELKEIFAAFQNNMHALLHYAPKPIDFHVTVFQAAFHSDGVNSRLRPWMASDPMMTIRSTPANHFTIMQEPAIEQIAETINQVLHELAPYSQETLRCDWQTT